MFRQMHLLIIPLALVCGSCERESATPTTASTTPASTRSLSTSPDRPIVNAYPTASEVRLFVNVDYNEAGEPIFNKPAGRLLSLSQRTEFEAALLVHTIAPDEDFAACFIPHHFFRYFDKRGVQIGEIEVCFCCAGVQASGASNIALTRDQILSADYSKLEAFVRSLGEPTDVQCD